MTRNPNTRIAELQPGAAAKHAGKNGRATLGTLLAAAFIAVVSLIANRFYQ